MSAQLQIYAVVQNGVVVNTALWDGVSEWTLPTGTQAVAIPSGTVTGIDATYSGGVFGAPPAS
jgi:hypothetical protein